MKNFFISYNKADRDCAVWIDQQLRDAGYTTTIQAADMPPGSAFVHEMDKAVEENEGLIAVLSPDYLNSPYCESEWQAFYQKDPNGEKRELIPVRGRECQPKGLLAQRVYIDLVGKDGVEARQILLDGVKAAREKLELSARYPVDDLFSGYLDQIRRRVSTVRIFGDDRPYELDQVFVELTLNEEYDHCPNQADFLGLMDVELRRMRSVFGDADQRRDREGADDFANRGFAKTKRAIKPDELLRRRTHAVVTGAPGCGKTTLLRYLAWQTLKEFGVPPSDDSIQSQNKPLEGGDPNYRLPVFLELKQLTAVDFQQAQGQLEHLLFNKAISAAIKPGEAEYGALKDRFLAMLREGRVAIFLDGLDEVSGASFFQDLQRAITNFLHSVYGANIVIISTRPFALRQFGDAKMMEIQPLNPRQIEQFIEHYYRDVPGRQQFQRELQRRRELRELARVPALLGFILQLWRRRGSVTDDKPRLYEQITLELARHLDTDKEGVHPDRKWLVEDNDGSLKLDLLRQLAFNRLFKGFIRPPYDIGSTGNDVNRLIFTSEQLRDEAAAFACSIKEREGITINSRNLAEDVKATALLRQVGADHYAFAHLTLQEYLAAWQLAKCHDAATCEGIFCRIYFNPTLAEMEVLPMTLGLVDEPDRFYEALERLPESLSLTGLRLSAGGLGYASVSQQALKALIDKLDRFISLSVCEADGYRDAVLKAYANARGEDLRLILQRIAEGLAPDKDDYEREYAVEALALFHNESAAVLLRNALADKHADVRIRAAAAISWCDMDCSIDALKEELKSPDEEVRKNVVYAAWQSIGEQAIEVLIAALRDESATVREAAVEALGDVGGGKCVGLLIEVLQTNSGRASERAAEALGDIGGDEALNGLLDALERSSIESRQKIIEALGEIGDARAVPSLLKIVENAQSFDRKGAVKALGKIKSDLQIVPLIRLFNETKAKWIEQLGESDDGFILFGEDHESLLITLAESLLNLGQNSYLDFLLDILERDEGCNTSNAVKALSNIDSDVVDKALQTAWDKALSRYASERQNERVGANGERVIPVLTGTPDLLIQLADALTKRRRQEIVSIIVEWISDKNFVRGLMGDGRIAHIVNSLGRCKGKQAVDGLVKIFHSGKFHSDFMALAGLGNIQDEYAIAGLLRGFLVPQSYIQMRAVYRMISMDNKTIFDGLSLALSDSNNFVRRKATEFIAYYTDPRDQCLIERLYFLAANDDSEKVRETASQSAQKSERKVQYFDIPITATTTDDHSQPSLSPPLTAQERAELETRISTKYQEMLRCSDARQKGTVLEELLAAVFASIPGFTVIERNYHTTTEEIDLVVRNASADPFWRGWGSLILVEAKHWHSQRVGKNEYVQFYRKMENRGGHCMLGFLICTERFAETFEKEMLRDSKFPLRVAPIDGEDLQRLVEAQDRGDILRGFVERALLT
jgi:HEAT repeat protein